MIDILRNSALSLSKQRSDEVLIATARTIVGRML